MNKLLQKLKELIQRIKDLFAAPKDISVAKPAPMEIVIPPQTVVTTISQVPTEQKGSVTDKLFGISAEEKARREAAGKKAETAAPIPVLINGDTLRSAGTIHIANMKAFQTLTVNLGGYSGPMEVGMYETVGSDPTASFTITINNVTGHCGQRAGHVAGTGPALIQITANKDTTTHVIWKKK